MILFRAQKLDSEEWAEGYLTSEEMIAVSDEYVFGVIGSGEYFIDTTTLQISFDGETWNSVEEVKTVIETARWMEDIE